MRKNILEKGPYLRSIDLKIISTKRMMIDLLIGLLPIIIFGFVLNGLIPFINGQVGVYRMFEPLLKVLTGAFASLLFEFLYFWLVKRVKGFKNILEACGDSFPTIPGIILSLLLPTTIPYYVIVFGCFLANIVFKMLFGGLGHNIFNPALIGYAFCVLAFGGLIVDSLAAEAAVINATYNIVASPTPLSNLSSLVSANASFMVGYNDVVLPFGSLLKMFIGIKGGTIGEVSGLLCLVGYIWLVVRKVINWRVPVFMVGTVFVLTWIIGIVNHVEGSLLGIWFPTFNILSGGLLFGAVFMATEPVTTPKNKTAKVFFAVGCGIFTVLFRFLGLYSEGVCTAILLMCLFTPLLDDFVAKTASLPFNQKKILRYLVLVVIFALIAFYVVFKTRHVVASDLESMPNIFLGDYYG